METNPRRLMNKLLSPEQRAILLQIVAQAGALNMPCYLVGGVARDLLLRKSIRDLDVIVEGDAILLAKALLKAHGGALTLHPVFRTAIWNPRDASLMLDLISARAEVYAHPGALPAIRLDSIDEDIRRRDFSINTLALRLTEGHWGELLDPLNGQRDLKDGLVRALHPRSFCDDPTRIFRAARYEQRYGFNIESQTRAWINAEALQTLKNLSGERIRHELDLILQEENAARMIARLWDLCALEALQLPGWEAAVPLWIPPPARFNLSVERILLGYLRWLGGLSLPAAEQTSVRLAFDSKLKAALLALISLKQGLPALQNAKPSVWTLHLEKVPLVVVYAAWLQTKIPALDEFLSRWRHIKPHINGENLKARGIPPGPRYKEILLRLRAAWLDGEIQDPKEEERFL